MPTSPSFVRVPAWWREVPSARMELWLLFAALVALNALDLSTTAGVLAAGGRELNPVMAPVFAAGSVPAAAAMKAAVLLVVAVALVRPIRRHGRIGVMLAVVTGAYLAVCVWNTSVLAVAL